MLLICHSIFLCFSYLFLQLLHIGSPQKNTFMTCELTIRRNHEKCDVQQAACTLHMWHELHERLFDSNF